MKTYQDLQKAIEKGKGLAGFIRTCIEEYKSSDMYQTAVIADEYDRHLNRTILQYQKLLYTLSGSTVPDNFSANFKVPSNHFGRFVSHQTQYLLGNGITWKNGDTVKNKLGKDFDYQVQKAARTALVTAVGYGFFNLDHVEVFSALDFVPFFDETNGALMAGIRFWQIDDTKPLRAVLYELDGYTDYMYRAGKATEVNPKRTYKQIAVTTPKDGTEIFDGDNYPSFPIVPCYANPHKQSEFIGMREQIDAYDLIKSGFCNDLDDASQIYWTIQNGGGMDDVDLATFVQRMKTVKAAILEDDGATAEAHTLEVPFNAREAILTRLENDMYKDFMIINPYDIANGAVTATQIKAAYEPMNVKTDSFEYCVTEFITGILEIAGITDEEPTFDRSMIINQTEMIQNVAMSALYLPRDYVTSKIMTILGDGDMVESALEQIDEEDYTRMASGTAQEGAQEPESGEKS